MSRKHCRVAVAALLGHKEHPIGTSLPAFITPNILKVLVEKFNIMPIKTAEEDRKAIFG